VSDFKPGDVCVATVRGVEGVRVMRGHTFWWMPDPDLSVGGRHLDPEETTDVRPLVVLDVANGWGLLSRGDCIAALHRSVEGEWTHQSEFVHWLANQIALSGMAQTKLPRIPEPGLWGIVKASVESYGSTRGRFIRDGEDASHYWECLDWPGTYAWEHLVDPVELRPGIEEES
jgi:hypothetical protein